MLQHLIGQKQYEMTDHLGNVRAVVSDTKTDTNATVNSYYHYYAFGAMIAGRTIDGLGYRFGFNGQMKTNEIAGIGNHYVFKAREYDPRTGCFLVS
jgi:hypothetical protein